MLFSKGDDFTIKSPVFDKNTGYASVETGEACTSLIIQTPRMTLRKTIEREQETLFLEFSNSRDDRGLNAFYDLIMSIGDAVCDKIASNAQDWFPESSNPNTRRDGLTAKIIKEELFKSSVCLPENYNGIYRLKVELPLYGEECFNFEIYDHKKNKIDPFRIKKNSEMTFLLQCKEIQFSSSVCQIFWEVVQGKVHRPQKIKKYRIREE